MGEEKVVKDKAERTSKRKTRTGKVISNKMDKSIVVAVEKKIKHKLYKKVLQKYDKVHGA